MANARSTISKVLGVDNSASWDIVSSDPENNLFMVHHKSDANLSVYGNVRGTVIDIVAETVVCSSAGYMPTTISNRLTLEEDGNIHLFDDFGREQTANPANMKIRTGYEGTIIRVFKHAGKVYRVTRKSLNPIRSRWGNSKPFIQIYEELNGPSDDALFNPNSDYSPYCHSFILVHPDLVVSTKDIVGTGYIIYLGVEEMWSVVDENCPYKQTKEDGSMLEGVTQEQFDQDPRPNAGWIDSTIYSPNTYPDNIFETKIGNILSPIDLTIEQANKRLTSGFYDAGGNLDNFDCRMIPGEFVIIYKLREDGSTESMIKVESPSYVWRSTIRDNNPNLLNRFYQLIDASYNFKTEDQRQSYSEMFPTFTPFDPISISNSMPIIMWMENTEMDYSQILVNKDSRLYNIWISFMMSVPLHKQYEVFGYLTSLKQSQDELVGWLRKMEDRGSLDPAEFSRRVLDIVKKSRSFAQQEVKKGNNGNNRNRGYKRKLSVKDITRRNIRNFINKEIGSSLYRLVKEMNQWKNEEAAERVESESVISEIMDYKDSEELN